MKRSLLVGCWLALVVGSSGCSLAPKSFRDMVHPAPIVRARAVGLDDQQPESVAIPALIERLNDPDRVVRMTANDGLKERTQRDFGFVAWGSPEDRAAAIGRWKGWWEERRGQTAYPKDESLLKVSNRPTRRRPNGVAGVQEGTKSRWPSTSSAQPSPAY